MLRVVQVRHIPPDMEFYGRGPLLACKYIDASILWHRAEQIAQVLEEVCPFLLTPLMHPWRDHSLGLLPREGHGQLSSPCRPGRTVYARMCLLRLLQLPCI